MKILKNFSEEAQASSAIVVGFKRKLWNITFLAAAFFLLLCAAEMASKEKTISLYFESIS